MEMRHAKFRLGQVVRHRVFPYRGVVFDVDARFHAPDALIPSSDGAEVRAPDQPFYHLLAEAGTSCYTAYVGEENLLPDDSGEPVEHPGAQAFFTQGEDGSYHVPPGLTH